jgi:hypothetical protein
MKVLTVLCFSLMCGVQAIASTPVTKCQNGPTGGVSTIRVEVSNEAFKFDEAHPHTYYGPFWATGTARWITGNFAVLTGTNSSEDNWPQLTIEFSDDHKSALLNGMYNGSVVLECD